MEGPPLLATHIARLPERAQKVSGFFGDIMSGDHDKTFQQTINEAPTGTFDERLASNRIMALLRPLIAVWRAGPELAQAPANKGEGEGEESEKEGEKHGSEDETFEEIATEDPWLVHLRQEADHELKLFHHGILWPGSNQLLLEAIREKDVIKNSPSADKRRVHFVDPGVAAEVGTFSQSHSPFSRKPGVCKTSLSAFEAVVASCLASAGDGDGQDIGVLPTLGSDQVKKETSKVAKRCLPTVAEFSLVFSEVDLKGRFEWSKVTKSNRIAKKAKHSTMAEFGGGPIEQLLVATVALPDFVDKPHKYIPADSSTIFPVWPCPLLTPDNIFPRVTQQVKDEILGGVRVALGDEEPARSAEDDTAAGTEPKEWLFTHERDPCFLAEVFYAFDAETAVIYNGGGGASAKACLRAKVIALVIYKNSLHREVVTSHLKEWLVQRMSDPTDSRFYRARPTEHPEVNGSEQGSSQPLGQSVAGADAGVDVMSSASSAPRLGGE